jgi:hypothetical protein
METRGKVGMEKPSGRAGTIVLTSQAVRQIIADHLQRTRGVSISPHAVRPRSSGGDLSVEVSIGEPAGEQGSSAEQQGS